MAEKEGLDNNDSKKSEFSSLEEIDLDDQIEIISLEKDTIESLEVMPEDLDSEEVENDSGQEVVQEEVLSEETENGSNQSDSEIFKEIKLPSNLDDGESEGSPKDKGADNSPATADGHKDGKSDPSKIKDRIDKDRDSEKLGEKPKAKTIVGNWSFTQIIIGLTLLLMGFAGGVVCMKPALPGFKKEAEPVTLKTKEPPLAVVPASKQVEPAKPLSKNDTYLAKIRQAGLLRDELLAKKEEIYQLKQYYQDGIAALTAQINRELEESGITSYTQALKNRQIELNLRTIQRRRSYIQRLAEPIRWIKQGREELLFLKRKAEFDLNLIDIAGGIDMDRHMRHIDAAIQKYRPSAENLAIGREHADPTPLETIWDQIKVQKKNNDPGLPNEMDQEITKEICSGNYERTSELTRLSAVTARCLSKMPGSDLFLNGLTELSPAAAEYLFHWRGSWICLNGIEELSPAAAQHLFKWAGNWISLNGLTEFRPELATYLMEWEGSQLELMGLGYNKKNVDQKTLKYLALWEAMGGKLFIADDLRQEIKRVTM